MQTLSFHESTALGFAKRAAEAKDLTQGTWFMRQANRHEDKAGLTLEEIEAKVEAAPVCSVKAIRRFFAICKSAGVDASSDERVRGALSVFFSKKIVSRKDLTTDMWLSAGDAIERGQLVF